jgi:hypothetical protein
MQIALITTTINVPKVLALYRKLGPGIEFFVAADEKTPLAAYEFCSELGNCEIYSPDRQRELGYECSELLGWNTDSRRNIALLEAVKADADFIISADDDMLPLGLDFFERFEMMLSEPYSGLQFGYPGAWGDVGRLTVPPVPQRGLPLGFSPVAAYSFAIDAQIGAMQGVILGTPDTDAGTMLRKPFVHSATDILRNGFVIDPNTRAVFNSQLTGFRRELAPCFAQFYKWQGRNTDIFASMIMRRVMLERNLSTYFGPPFGFHNRSERDPRKDLEAELWGNYNVIRFQACLDDTMLTGGTVTEQTRYLYDALAAAGHVPDGMLEAVHAFLSDVEKVL